jgi:S-(hydroxymethyl)glutathione dehydrogenase / alcohol dehydrogenase
MRAALLKGLNEELEVRDDIQAEGPGHDEVRVRIAATGVCHSDLSGQDGTLPHPMPVVLGHEGAGEVIAIGDGVTTVAPGDHVIISWVPPCGSCRFCLGGQPNLCSAFLSRQLEEPKFRAADLPVFGFAGTGTFAEECVVPVQAAIPIDADIPFDVAALVGCGVMTGVGAALNTANVRPGSQVVVFGCGGVGISVIQGARIAGAAEIVAVDVVEPKLELARDFGATHATTPDGLPALVTEHTGGLGFDYAFEVVGRPETIRNAWEATRRGGTTVVVGAGRMDAMVPFSAFELFYFERKLLGCWYGSADVRTDFHRLLRLWRHGKLELEGMITRRIDLSEINEAFQACRNGEVIRSVIEFK